MGKAGTGLQTVETFGRSFAGDVLSIALVDIRGDELRAVCIGAGHHDRRRTAHVGRKPRRDQVALVRCGRDQNLAAEVTALLLRRELVLEMHAGSACFDECLHDLEGVERSAETGFGIGHDRRKPVALGAAFGVLDLVGAGQRLIDAATWRRGHRWSGAARLRSVWRLLPHARTR